MASEDVGQDNLAEVENQNEEKTETADIATSDAKGEGTESKSNQQDEVEKEVKLYVGNLPDQCRRGALQELFEKYGKVSQCDIVKNFAFVVSFTCLKWCFRIAAYAPFRHHIDCHKPVRHHSVIKFLQHSRCKSGITRTTNF